MLRLAKDKRLKRRKKLVGRYNKDKIVLSLCPYRPQGPYRPFSLSKKRACGYLQQM